MSRKEVVDDNHYEEFERHHGNVDARTSAKGLWLMQQASDLEIDKKNCNASIALLRWEYWHKDCCSHRTAAQEEILTAIEQKVEVANIWSKSAWDWPWTYFRRLGLASAYIKELAVLVVSPGAELLHLLSSGWPSPFFASSGSEKALPLPSLPIPQHHSRLPV